MFTHQSSAEEIFSAMQDGLVKTAKVKFSSDRDTEIRNATTIIGLNKVAQKLEQTGRFKAATIVVNMMTKMAASESELPQTMPPEAGEEVAMESVLSGKFSPVMFAMSRINAKDAMEAVRRLAEEEFGEDATTIVERFEQELLDIHDLYPEDNPTVPQQMELYKKYQDFVAKAKAFLTPDEPEEADIASAKDKEEIGKLLKMFKMFGFQEKDVDDPEEKPKGETSEFLQCLK